MGTCLYCSNQTAAGCQMCNPNESHETWLQKTITIDNPYQEQLDRIEAQNKEILALLAKKKPKPRAAMNLEYPDWFEDMWKGYPKRAGSNPKQKAYKAARARIQQDVKKLSSVFAESCTLASGVLRYADYCKATGKTGTEYVMQAATFFGPERHYLETWKIPKPKEKNGQPEIFSQSHQDADFSGQAEKELDPVDPYASLK